MIRLFLLISSMLAALVAHTYALASERLVDKTELSFAADWVSHTNDLSGTVVSTTVARFFTPNLQWRLGLTYQSSTYWNSGEATRTTTGWSAAPALAFNVKSPRMPNTVPYVGVAFQFSSTRVVHTGYWSGVWEGSNSGPQVFAGVRLFVGGDYNSARHAFFSEFRHGKDVFQGNNRLLFGITNFF